MKLSRLIAVAWKELIQLRRDKLTFGMMVGIPVIQLLLFGYAINTDVRHIPAVVVDGDASSASRLLPRQMEASGTFDLVAALPSVRDVEPWLRSGRASVALVIPPRYEADLARGRPPELEVIVDGSDPQLQSAALLSLNGLFSSQTQGLMAARLGRPGQPPIPLKAETNSWYNPEMRTAVFVVPGLTGLILTMTMIMMTAMAIARERERGTLEQIIVSPVTRLELTAGKIFPYVLIGYVQMTLILAIGRWVFDVPIVGSLPLLYGLAFLFISANLALGMLVSTGVKNQQQAMQLTFFIFLPNILLSGFMFPFTGMPRPAQILAETFPLTHFLRIVRGIVLKGATLPELLPEVGALGLILFVLMAVATVRFSKKLD